MIYPLIGSLTTKTNPIQEELASLRRKELTLWHGAISQTGYGSHNIYSTLNSQ